MIIDSEQGILAGARYVPSPNCNDRPPATPVDLIVVHGISLPPGEFGGPWLEALFTNALEPAVHPYFEAIQGLRVSAHLLIRRTGEIVQYVPFQRRAWHAGESCYGGKRNCNDFSIGIELEGTNEIPYTAVQYQQLAQAIAALMRVYPAITPARIVGHADIAPGRKTDPGPAFDWKRLRQAVAAVTPGS